MCSIDVNSSHTFLSYMFCPLAFENLSTRHIQIELGQYLEIYAKRSPKTIMDNLVNIRCGRKPECREETNDFRQSIDSFEYAD